MARLLMELLARPNHKTKNSFRDHLRNLPDAPEDAYRQLWARILGQEESDASLARRIFSWVAFSKEPLTIRDLQYGLHLSTDPRTWPFDADDLILEEELGSVCLGVIALKPKTSDIAFVHHTAELFFPRFLTSEFAVEAHRQISVSCMRYLRLLGNLQDCSLDMTLPLQAYAGRHWGTHVANISSSIILDEVIEFLTSEESLLKAATLLQQTLWTNNHSMLRTRAPAIENITSLHLAAYFGLIEVSEKLVFTGQTQVDTSGDGYWTALRWAVISRQQAMVEYLTTQGAAIELADDEGNNVLMWALGHGRHFSRVGDLEIHDCSVHIGARYHYKSLEQMLAHPREDATATARTSAKILDFLVVNTMAINAHNNAGRSTLAIAAENRHTRIVGHLLQRGADINSTDNRGMTPLLWALQPKSRHVFENINIYGDACVHIGLHIIVDSSMPEYHEVHAIEDDPGHYESMLMLLVGSELDATDAFGRTALSLAAEKGLQTLVNKLLESGADVTVVDDRDRTAYDWAFLHPVSHRIRVQNVNLYDSAHVFLGVQYEYRDFGSEAMPILPEINESRVLLARNLLKHLRCRGIRPSSCEVFGYPMSHYDRNSFHDDSIGWLGGCFDLVRYTEDGTQSIKFSESQAQQHLTDGRYTNVCATGQSQVEAGMAMKPFMAKPWLNLVSVTWRDAFTSDELRARKILIRATEQESSIVTKVMGQKLDTEGRE